MGVKNMDCYRYGSLARKEPNLAPHIFNCDFPFVKKNLKSKIFIKFFRIYSHIAAFIQNLIFFHYISDSYKVLKVSIKSMFITKCDRK